MGFEPMMATELEFFLFEESFSSLFDSGYRQMTAMARHNVDYSIWGTSRDEPIMRDIRCKLWDAGIPIECSKGEADAGQEEVNARYSDAMDTADMHSIIKLGVKQIAQEHGASVTFMAKYDHRRAGSSSRCLKRSSCSSFEIQRKNFRIVVPLSASRFSNALIWS